MEIIYGASAAAYTWPHYEMVSELGGVKKAPFLKGI